MKRVLVATVSVLLLPSAALAQDPVKAFPNQYHVVLDNPEVRVLHVMAKPGEKTSMHEHPDHVAVVLSDSKMRFTMPDGTSSDAALARGEALFIPGGKHAGENTGTGPVEAIVVELKKAGGAKAQVPASRSGMQATTLVENEKVAAVKVTADPGFAEPAGSTHEFSQVVVALEPGDFTLNVDGKTTTSWKPGDVRYIGRGVKHESKNTGGKPLQFVIVAVK